MDFIFMLTRGDKTVEDCLDVLAQVAPLGLKHIGFKDVGAARSTLSRLTERIAAMNNPPASGAACSAGLIAALEATFWSCCIRPSSSCCTCVMELIAGSPLGW